MEHSSYSLQFLLSSSGINTLPFKDEHISRKYPLRPPSQTNIDTDDEDTRSTQEAKIYSIDYRLMMDTTFFKYKKERHCIKCRWQRRKDNIPRKWKLTLKQLYDNLVKVINPIFAPDCLNTTLKYLSSQRSLWLNLQTDAWSMGRTKSVNPQEHYRNLLNLHLR